MLSSQAWGRLVTRMHRDLFEGGEEPWCKNTTSFHAKHYIRLRLESGDEEERAYPDLKMFEPKPDADDDLMSVSDQEPSTAAGSGSNAPALPELRRNSEETEENWRLRVILQQTGYRWREECITRDALDQGMDWSTSVPDSQEHRHAQQVLAHTVNEYINNWDQQLCMRLPRARWPTSMRVLTVEMIWCLEQMHSSSMVPRHLWFPHDKGIRNAASEAALGQEDPGNLVWEDVVAILRLSRYVCPTRREQIKRVTPTDYGVGTNMSAKGTINLRGNIVEAMCHDFQARASAEDGGWGSTWKRWRDRG